MPNVDVADVHNIVSNDSVPNNSDPVNVHTMTD